MSIGDDLIKKLEEKQGIIGIVGLGYVGQPLAIRFSEVGYAVLGFDTDNSKVDQLNDGKTSIQHIGNSRIATARKRGFSATSDFSRIPQVDAIILCVPTPLNKYREPDLSFVISSCESIAPNLRAGQIISLESTTYPGTTEEEIVPRLEKSGLVAGKEFFVVFSPEREDPGNPDFTTETIPKVVGGYTQACLKVGEALYSRAINEVITVSNTRTAEMTKLLENIQRSVNIGLVNEMKVVADRMGIDIYEVIDAAATKPFGFVPYYPGPGVGGHCIPVDPFYLTWKAREYGLHTRFIELAGEINRSMPEYIKSKLVMALNSMGKPLKDTNILVLGIAYKKNVDDMRESTSVQIMELLRSAGARVEYSDPHVPVFPKMREHVFDLKSVALTAESISKFDAVILATDHTLFDYDLIKDNSELIVDCRGVYRNNPAHHIVRA